MLDHFSDGGLWAGLGRNPDVASIQATWAEELKIDLRDKADPLARALNNAIGQRRLLIVLDDAWKEEPLRTLRCPGPHVVHLMTTRDQAIARTFAGAAQSVNVPLLEELPSRALLAMLVPDANEANADAVEALADQVDGLPLALELLGGYLAAPERSLFPDLSEAAFAELADPAVRLALATTRLGDVHNQQQTLVETIGLSLEELGQVAPLAVAAFHALGAFAPKPARFDREAAEAVTQADGSTLALLISRNLLEMEGGEQPLALHQALHDVARTSMPAEMGERHRNYYLGVVDRDQRDWRIIEVIYPQVVFAWSLLAEGDLALVRFTNSLWRYQPLRGLWRDRLVWLEKALKAARIASRTSDEGRLLNDIGFVYDALGEKGKALDFYNEALPLRREVGDSFGEATTLNNIGGVYSALGEKGKALDFYNEALPLRREVGDRSGEAITLNNIGRVYSAVGEKEKALVRYNEALLLAREAGDRAREATVLTNIGGVYSSLGEKGKALEQFNEVLPIQCEVGDRFGEIITRWWIARMEMGEGNREAAVTQLQLALSIAEEVRSPNAQAIREYLAQIEGAG